MIQKLKSWLAVQKIKWKWQRARSTIQMIQDSRNKTMGARLPRKFTESITPHNFLGEWNKPCKRIGGRNRK